jgi:uncharacterized protein (UPF0248 family)
MASILELVNKIRWDPREKPEAYTLFYLDRMSKELKTLPFMDIKRIEGTFLIIERDGEETNIPLHRVRKVERDGKSVWERH